MGTAVKHPLPDRVKSSFVIFDIQALLTLSPEHQTARMSKIANDNPVWHRMLYSCTHMTTVGFKGFKEVWEKTAFYTVSSADTFRRTLLHVVHYAQSICEPILLILSGDGESSVRSSDRLRVGHVSRHDAAEVRPSLCPSRSVHHWQQAAGAGAHPGRDTAPWPKRSQVTSRWKLYEWKFPLTLWRPLLPYGYNCKAFCARPGCAVICNFWHPGTLTLVTERQDVKNYKWRLNPDWHSRTGCFVAVPIWQQWASKG